MKKDAEEAGEVSTEEETPKAAPSRGMPILDLILRLIAAIGTLGSAIAVGTTNDTLPMFARFMHFRAKYQDLPTFTFFVFTNAITCAYLVLSLALSVFHILKTGAKVTRTVLIALDMIFLALLTAGASAAASVVHLARKGNVQANWFPICQQYNTFCERISGALVGTFIGVLVLMVLIIMSSVALSRA